MRHGYAGPWPAARGIRHVGQAATFALALTSLGCGTSAAFTCPARGGPPWTEITSRHFVLRTDLDAAEAREAIGRYEATHAALEDLAFTADTKPPGKTLVVLFRRETEFHAVAPEGAEAFFTRLEMPGEDAVPTMVLAADRPRHAHILFQHELTHRFVRFYYPQAPRWLNEGMAQYFSTLEVEGGEAVLGQPLPYLGFTNGGWSHRMEMPFDRVLVPVSVLPSVANLVRTSDKSFTRKPWALWADDPVTLNYAASWALVHLFKNGPAPYPERWDRLLHNLGQGMKPTPAMEDAFQTLDAAKIQGNLRGSLSGRGTTLLKTAYTPRPSPPESERALRDAEVHFVWAALRRDDEAGRVAFRADVEEVFAREPGSLAALLWSAESNSVGGNAPAAEAALDRAAGVGPSDPRYLYVLFRHRYRAQQKAPATERRWDAVEALVPELSKVTKSARALNHIAWYFAIRGRPDEGLPVVRRAIAEDWSCSDCYDTLGVLLYEKGAIDQAVEAQTIAVNMMSESRPSRAISERLDHFRAAAVGARANPGAVLPPLALEP